MCDTVRLINAWMWLVYWFLDEDRHKNRASDSKRNKADRQKYVLGLYKTEVYRYTLQMDPNAVLGITMIHQWMFHVFFPHWVPSRPNCAHLGPRLPSYLRCLMARMMFVASSVVWHCRKTSPGFRVAFPWPVKLGAQKSEATAPVFEWCPSSKTMIQPRKIRMSSWFVLANLGLASTRTEFMGNTSKHLDDLDVLSTNL